VIMRWRWIEISPKPIPLSDLVRFLSVAPKKPKLTLVRPCAFSPRDTTAYAWMTIAGIAKNHLGSYEQGIGWCRRAIEANRNYPEAYFHLAIALAQLGRLDEAHSAVKAGLALNPSFTVSRARADWTAMSDDPTHPAQLEPVLEGLRKAGVPEQ